MISGNPPNLDNRPMIQCRDHVLKALGKEQLKRHSTQDPDVWILNERMAVTKAANEWAIAHKLPTITVDDVEIAERPAVGHVDYSSKFALYVAEKVCYG